jgi:hypothetical protein
MSTCCASPSKLCCLSKSSPKSNLQHVSLKLVTVCLHRTCYNNALLVKYRIDLLKSLPHSLRTEKIMKVLASKICQPAIRKGSRFLARYSQIPGTQQLRCSKVMSLEKDTGLAGIQYNTILHLHVDAQSNAELVNQALDTPYKNRHVEGRSCWQITLEDGHTVYSFIVLPGRYSGLKNFQC